MNIEKHQNSEEITVPEGLFDKVILKIRVEQRLAVIRQRFILAISAFLSALVLAIPAWNVFWADFSTSGLMDYVKLLFSDFKSVAIHWQDFGLSLLESFPIIGTLELLSIIFVVLLALRFIVKDSKELFVRSPLVKIN